MLREPGTNFLRGVKNDLRSTENGQNESHLQDHLDERMTPHLSIQDNIPMCQECGRDSSKCPRRLPADQTNDDYSSISITPKISNKSKNGTLSDSQIAKSVLLNNAVLDICYYKNWIFLRSCRMDFGCDADVEPPKRKKQLVKSSSEIHKVGRCDFFSSKIAHEKIKTARHHKVQPKEA